jgi:hypothetical protein
LVEFKIQKGKKGEGLSISHSKKSIAIISENKMPVIEVTNEYGNAVRYEISEDYKFDSVWSQLWQFVKDSQH